MDREVAVEVNIVPFILLCVDVLKRLLGRMIC